MIHGRMAFAMPASPELVFDAFHYHPWRAQWDSLVRNTHVVGGGECPYVDAETENAGAGWMDVRAGHAHTLQWLLEPVTQMLFALQTRKRFARLQRFLARHAADVVHWQLQRNAGVAK